MDDYIELAVTQTRSVTRVATLVTVHFVAH